MHPIETEVKFHLADPAAARARLLAIGASSSGCSFERNIRFDDRHLSLEQARCLLRLRRDRTSTLTFKSSPADADPEVKQLAELEVGVECLETMQRILQCLGYHPAQTYEKWRETLALDRTVFCLDRLPFGEFLEIEGPKEEIRRFADRLELDWGRRILATYLDIFTLIRGRQQLPFTDVTFGNFEGNPVDIRPYLPMLEAERGAVQPLR
jgi:adenylate cyclase class 2